MTEATNEETFAAGRVEAAEAREANILRDYEYICYYAEIGFVIML